MPAVPKTSDEDVVAAAREILAKRGLATLSMQDVASAVGVRTSSLYKRFADREAILNAVAREVFVELEKLQRRVAVLGPAKALHGDRLLVAFTHGFISMELDGAFRLGGSWTRPSSLA